MIGFIPGPRQKRSCEAPLQPAAARQTGQAGPPPPGAEHCQTQITKTPRHQCFHPWSLDPCWHVLRIETPREAACHGGRLHVTRTHVKPYPWSHRHQAQYVPYRASLCSWGRVLKDVIGFRGHLKHLLCTFQTRFSNMGLQASMRVVGRACECVIRQFGVLLDARLARLWSWGPRSTRK